MKKKLKNPFKKRYIYNNIDNIIRIQAHELEIESNEIYFAALSLRLLLRDLRNSYHRVASEFKNFQEKLENYQIHTLKFEENVRLNEILSSNEKSKN